MALNFAGKSSGSAINGASVTLTISSSAAVAGNYVVVTAATGTSVVTGTVTTSSGGSYTKLYGPTVSSAGTLYMSIWATKLASTPTVQAVCSGNGRSTNGTAAVLIVLGDDGNNPVLDVAVTSTNGSGTTPDSPSITPTASNAVILTCVSAGVADSTVTAPTSFLNQADANEADTVGATAAMAMITLSSTGAFDPGAWSNFTSAVWLSATVAVRPGSTSLNTDFVTEDRNRFVFGNRETVPY